LFWTHLASEELWVVLHSWNLLLLRLPHQVLEPLLLLMDLEVLVHMLIHIMVPLRDSDFVHMSGINIVLPVLRPLESSHVALVFVCEGIVEVETIRRAVPWSSAGLETLEGWWPESSVALLPRLVVGHFYRSRVHLVLVLRTPWRRRDHGRFELFRAYIRAIRANSHVLVGFTLELVGFLLSELEFIAVVVKGWLRVCKIWVGNCILHRLVVLMVLLGDEVSGWKALVTHCGFRTLLNSLFKVLNSSLPTNYWTHGVSIVISYI
jgi:hypothetical protein